MKKQKSDNFIKIVESCNLDLFLAITKDFRQLQKKKNTKDD